MIFFAPQTCGVQTAGLHQRAWVVSSVGRLGVQVSAQHLWSSGSCVSGFVLVASPAIDWVSQPSVQDLRKWVLCGQVPGELTS